MIRKVTSILISLAMAASFINPVYAQEEIEIAELDNIVEEIVDAKEDSALLLMDDGIIDGLSDGLSCVINKDGYIISINADEGIFPADTTVSVKRITEVNGVLVEDLIRQGLDENDFVDKIAAFDIEFMSQGAEVEPEGGNVNVNIAPSEDFLEMLTDGHDDEKKDVKVFHIADDMDLSKIEADASADGINFSADSFSAYVLAVVEKFEYSGGILDDSRELKLSNVNLDLADNSVTGGTNNTTASFPAKYDNRKNMQILKDQGNYNTCWAHSSIALAEANAKVKGMGNKDFSEAHLAYFMYNTVNDPLGGLKGDATGYTPEGDDVPWDVGGNLIYSQMILANWMGVASENKYPYSDMGKEFSKSDAYNDAMHMTNSYIASSSDRDAVKNLIMKNGAAGVSYYASSGESYSSTYNSYFYPYKNKPTNHAVTIVGWDDNFSKNHFAGDIKPEGDGAWLIRNSWVSAKEGEPYYNSYWGYFWLSYYDGSLANIVFSFEVDDKNLYDNNYQYDGGAIGVVHMESDMNRLKSANVFTAKANASGETLRAVSFYSESFNYDYTVKIYLNPKKNNPQSGQLVSVATTKGHSAYPGYRMVKLNKPVLLDNGDRYAVVVDIKSKTGATIGVEYEIKAWITTKVHSEENQSFIYDSDAKKWCDVKGNLSDTCGNLRIKAFTDNGKIPDKKYSIKYVLLGGKNNAKNPTSRWGYTPTITLKNASRKGYTFAGWYKDTSYTTKVTKINKGYTGNITLYAKWIPNSYTICYDGNGAQQGFVRPQKAKYGKAFNLAKNSFKKKGYVFVGWSTKKNGKGKIYSSRQRVINLTGSNNKKIKLYAVWVNKKLIGR